MERKSITDTPVIAAVLVCWISGAATARAAPPTAQPQHPHLPSADTLHVAEPHVAPHNLDLRPPMAGDAAPWERNATRAAAAAEEWRNPQSRFAAASPAQGMSRAQEFANRFHHEGLPVARLWENHAALVSLGLNQKGKPGLWLIQKTH